MNPDIQFQLATKGDAKKICEIHKKAFKYDHFSSLFPAEMLEEYLEQLLRLSRFSIVAKKNQQLLGYLIAGENADAALHIFIKKYKIKILTILLMHPKFLVEKINKILFRMIGTKRKSLFPVRLYLIAVNPGNSKERIGTRLLEHFESNLKEHKIFNYGLSVRKKNKTAILFYEKMGFINEFEDNKAIYYYRNLTK